LQESGFVNILAVQIDIALRVTYFIAIMFSLRKFISFVLIIAAFDAAMADFKVCSDSYGDTCETTCTCVCHSEPTFAFGDNPNTPFASVFHCVIFSDTQCSGILLIADVFRPPISA